jgi:hypothetical protein
MYTVGNIYIISAVAVIGGGLFGTTRPLPSFALRANGLLMRIA